MKVLVTGGAGFIGSHVVDALCRVGHSVLVIDSLDPGVFRAAPDYLNAQADYCFADLRYWEPDERVSDIEGVIHLAALGGVSRAAKEPVNIISANCGGTARLVDAARKWPSLRKFVLAGSFSVYGSGYRYKCAACCSVRDAGRNASDLEAARYDVYCSQCNSPAEIMPMTTSTTPSPLEIYGSSKYMQELCLQALPQVKTTILRFSSVYGTRLRLDDGEATIVAKLAGWIRDGKSPTLFEDGRQIRDWVYVGDLVDAIVAVLAGADSSPILNVCSGVPTTLMDACRIIASAMNSVVNPTIAGGYRTGDMRHCLGDASEFATLIGRSPLSFAQGARLVFG